MVISQPPPMHQMGGHQMGGFHQHQPAVMQKGPPGMPMVGPDGQIIDFDGKRLRKTMMRKTIDYSSSFLNMIQNRVWQRDFRDR